MSDLYEIGIVGGETMRYFHRRCFVRPDNVSAADNRAIRGRKGVSQAVLAEHLGITTGLVSKWERGDKPPCRMARKLLSVVKAKGLGVIAYGLQPRPKSLPPRQMRSIGFAVRRTAGARHREAHKPRRSSASAHSERHGLLWPSSS
jgi:putative transcriptional regulator